EETMVRGKERAGAEVVLLIREREPAALRVVVAGDLLLVEIALSDVAAEVVRRAEMIIPGMHVRGRRQHVIQRVRVRELREFWNESVLRLRDRRLDLSGPRVRAVRGNRPQRMVAGVEFGAQCRA